MSIPRIDVFVKERIILLRDKLHFFRSHARRKQSKFNHHLYTHSTNDMTNYDEIFPCTTESN